MTNGLICDVEPAAEPISLSEAKLHLKIDDSSPSTNPDDTLITGLIVAARRWCEDYQNRAYITQTWSLYLNRFPRHDHYIEIPKPPLQNIVSLSYKDGSGVLQTVSFLDPSGTYLIETDEYIVDASRRPGRLWLKNSATWPITLHEANAVIIQFVAGYGAATDVPAEIKSAILMKLSDLYENRGDVAANEGFERAAQALLRPNKIYPI